MKNRSDFVASPARHFSPASSCSTPTRMISLLFVVSHSVGNIPARKSSAVLGAFVLDVSFTIYAHPRYKNLRGTGRAFTCCAAFFFNFGSLRKVLGFGIVTFSVPQRCFWKNVLISSKVRYLTQDKSKSEDIAKCINPKR